MRLLDLFRRPPVPRADAHSAPPRCAGLASGVSRGVPDGVVPAALHAAAVFHPAQTISPDLVTNPCLVVADQAVFVYVDDGGALVVNVEVEAHEAFPGDAVPIRFEVLGRPVVSYDDTGRRVVHPDASGVDQSRPR